MDLNQIQAMERRPSLAGGLAFFAAGAVLVLVAVWLLQAVSTYHFDGSPTCDGEQMGRGDVCLQFGAGKSFDYDTGVRMQQAWGQTWRLLAALAGIGLGALLLVAGAVRLHRRTAPACLVGAGLLAAAAGYLLSLGTATGATGALVAAAAAVWVLIASGSALVRHAGLYAAGVGLLLVGAASLASAASYQPSGPGYGLDWSDPLHLFVIEVVQQHGDWVRIALAVLAAAGAALVVTAATDDPARPVAPRTAGSELVVAAAVAVAAGVFVVGAGRAGQVGLAVAVLLACYFALRAIAGLRGAGQPTRTAL